MAHASDTVRSRAVLAVVLGMALGPLGCKEPRPHAIDTGAGGTSQAPGGATGTGGNGTGAGGAATGGSLATGGRGTGGSNSGGAGTGTGGAATGGAPGSGGGGGLTSSGGAPGTGGSLSCNPACFDGARCNAGACVCISDGVTLCTDACVNLQLDPAHCGSCTNTCSGGCSLGRCFTQLTKNLDSGDSMRIAVNANYVFFTSSSAGTVSYVSRMGGAVRVIAASQNRPTGIAIDSTNVYWVNQGAGSVMKMPLFGGTAVPLATSELYPQDIAVDANNVYWDNFAYTGSIAKVPIAGGTKVTLASDPTMVNTNSMTIDGTNAYWTNWGDGANTGSIMKVPLAGGPFMTVANTINNPGFIAVFNGTVYFLAGGLANAGIQKVAATGGVVSSVPLTAGASALAVDGTGLFFTKFVTSSFTLTQVSLTGTTTTDLTEPLRSATQLVLDAGNVFWTSGADIGFTAKAP